MKTRAAVRGLRGALRASSRLPSVVGGTSGRPSTGTTIRAVNLLKSRAVQGQSRMRLNQIHPPVGCVGAANFAHLARCTANAVVDSSLAVTLPGIGIGVTSASGALIQDDRYQSVCFEYFSSVYPANYFVMLCFFCSEDDIDRI